MTQKTTQHRKHIPQRTCVACRQKFDKRSVTRLVYTCTGLAIDEMGKMNGRGAYLCNHSDCWARACKSNLLDRALRVSLSEVDKQYLIERQPS